MKLPYPPFVVAFSAEPSVYALIDPGLYLSMVSYANDFSILGHIDLSHFWCNSFETIGSFNSLFGLLVAMGSVFFLLSGNLKLVDIPVAFFKKEVFFILFFGFHCVVISLQGLSGSILLYLSRVRAALRSLRRSRGSTLASISHALDGVDLSAPQTNLRASLLAIQFLLIMFAGCDLKRG